MRLLLRGLSNQEGEADWGRLLIVTISKSDMEHIRLRCKRFTALREEDQFIIEMIYDFEGTAFYESMLEIKRGDDGAFDAEEEVLSSDAEPHVLLENETPIDDELDDVGDSHLVITKDGVHWQGAMNEGPDEVQTFPIPLEELDRLFATSKP